MNDRLNLGIALLIAEVMVKCTRAISASMFNDRYEANKQIEYAEGEIESAMMLKKTLCTINSTGATK